MRTIRERLNKLSPKQRQLLKNELQSIFENGIDGTEGQNQLRIAAFVTGKPELKKSDLKEFLKEKMPDHMVPSDIRVLDELPKLPNGKVDINALNQLKNTHTNIEPSSTENDLTPIEQKLIKIFEEILGFSPVKKDDNFFEIGGDSILSIQITAKARNQGLVIAPNQIFEYQTIFELAKVVEEQSPDMPADSQEPIQEKTNQQSIDQSKTGFPDAGLSQKDLDKLMEQLD